MFGVQKQIAHKMFKKETMASKRPLSNFTTLNSRLVHQLVRKMTKKTIKFATFWAKNLLKSTFLPLKYGLPNSFTTLST